MFYKLSNSASLEEVQNAFQKKVAYPSVYDPKVIVDGMTEDNLYILSTADPERFNIAIWG